jgi:large subunit ribosomal protein L10Ae
MSKLQASSVRQSVKTLLAQSSLDTYKEAGGKKRNFVETIELQIGLKNYDPQRDKRFVCWISSMLIDGGGGRMIG